MVDAGDLKSPDRKVVRVRVPSRPIRWVFRNIMSKTSLDNAEFPLVGRDNVNRYNRQLILSLFKDGKTLARRDIVALTGMRQGTMQVHVESLLKEGILIEKGRRASKAGRKPVLLQVNPKRHYIVGVYLKPDRIDFAVADLFGNIQRYHTEIPTVANDRTHLLLAFGRGLAQLSDNQIRAKKLLGIAIGLPGRVDTEAKVLIDTHFDSWWRDLSFGRYIRSQFGCNCWVENDIRLATLAESRFGAAKGIRNFVYVHISEQILMGLMLENHIYSGEDGVAGQLGHVCIDPNGTLCKCGNRGCVDTVASELALIEFYCNLAGVKKKNVTVSKIIMQARRGKAAALYAIEQISRWLGLSLANIANMLNPEKIILAGDISLAGEDFLLTANEIIKERTTLPTSHVKLEWSQLADKAVPMGAIALALDDFFALPVLETPLSLNP